MGGQKMGGNTPGTDLLKHKDAALVLANQDGPGKAAAHLPDCPLVHGGRPRHARPANQNRPETAVSSGQAGLEEA